MLRAALSRLTLAAGVALVLAACQQDQSPTAVIPSRPSASAQASQGSGPPAADQLDRQVPGFGGFFLDGSGAPTIYLTRGSSRAAAERALGGYLAARGLSNASLRVLEGRYGWQQLQRWQDAATEDAFQFAGTVFVDNDETSNRVRIGVENPNAAGQIRAALARRGMPDDAVIIERADPIVQVSTLQNVVDRPVRAGVQINFGLYVCSVGFNATSGDVKSFVTASHCTNKQGGVEGTKYGQPLLSNGTIATEVADPTYTKLKGCPGNKVCRYSDASRAAYTDGANQALGQIAMTSGANNGSLTITGTFNITSDDCTGTDGGCLIVGDVVNKVGRTTGWTQGAITNTCTNTGVQGTRIVQLCQTFVSAGVGGGDSGSDVFQITSTGVKLAGVLWGGNNSGTQFVFSPFANVVKELGALTTH
jgi:hypothetical protein